MTPMRPIHAPTPRPSYDALSNLVTFNVGHHREHHAHPGAHWTRLPTVRPEMRTEAARRVVPRAILLNPVLPLGASPPSGG
jgi:fatty acid desaturase